MLDPDLLADVKRVRRQLIDELLEMQEPGGYWTGELSTSALSTATTCVAFNELCKAGVTAAAGQPLRPLIDRGVQWLIDNVNADGGWGDTTKSKSNISTTTLCRAAIAACSGSAERGSEEKAEVLQRANAWIEKARQAHSTLAAAIVARYGKDKTFSVPILMQCALAGVVEWKEIPRLPFELAVLPHRFYAAVKLPVVSYALPALIAIGQLLHFKNPTWFLPLRWFRTAAINRTLRKLASLQPSNGGFLEAAPLTGFVTMALAATGRANHVVAQKGAEFLVNSVRPDGSWPIDTNLSTWVTTLIVNALGDSARDELPNPDATVRWLLDQQHTEVHPFTNAAPGGWAWTPLPGGVPDADDTAGAIRALMYLRPRSQGRGSSGEDQAEPTPQFVVPTSESGQNVPFTAQEGEAPAEPPTRSNNVDKESSVRDQPPATGQRSSGEDRGSSRADDAACSADLRVGTDRSVHSNAPSDTDAVCLPLTTTEEVDTAAANGLRWLMSLQNRDGGIPTFCKGWGTLPFDRSSCDITAHAALAASHVNLVGLGEVLPVLRNRCREHGIDMNSEAGKEQRNAIHQQIRDTSILANDKLLERVCKSTWNAGLFLQANQRSDGSWTPLWFGNENLEVEENPVYGTARVAISLFNDRTFMAARARIEAKTSGDSEAIALRPHEAILFLVLQMDKETCGIGGGEGTPASVEETAVAVEAILGAAKVVRSNHPRSRRLRRYQETGDSTPWLKPWMYEQPLRYLVDAIDRGEHRDAKPIGFYFAKLWYYEKLYPYAFSLGALQAAVDLVESRSK